MHYVIFSEMRALVRIDRMIIIMQLVLEFTSTFQTSGAKKKTRVPIFTIFSQGCDNTVKLNAASKDNI